MKPKRVKARYISESEMLTHAADLYVAAVKAQERYAGEQRRLQEQSEKANAIYQERFQELIRASSLGPECTVQVIPCGNMDQYVVLIYTGGTPRVEMAGPPRPAEPGTNDVPML